MHLWNLRICEKVSKDKIYDHKISFIGIDCYNSHRRTNKDSTYTVKYIGVVSGTMGILSRKMRMPKYYQAAIYENNENRYSDSIFEDTPDQNYGNRPKETNIKVALLFDSWFFITF